MSGGRYSVDAVVRWSDGRLLCGAAETMLEGTSIDTRTIESGSLFVAIRGPHFDAHQFLPEAAARGAAAIVVQAGFGRPTEIPDHVAIIEVDDTTRALGKIAAGHRQNFEAPVVAITGSSGKTTSKDMCASILGIEAPCLHTSGNLNNEYGLPLTLLRQEQRHQSAVIELGMNHRGEIALLAAIAKPDIALITNAGVAHIEFLESRDAIAQEKGDLFASLRADGIAIANADDARILAQATRAPGRVIRYGRGDAADTEVRCENVRYEARGSFAFDLIAPQGRTAVSVAGLADTSVINALGASAAALAAGATLDQVAKGLAAYRPSAHRMNPVAIAGGIQLIDDTYNANPHSMQAALETLAARRGSGRTIAVLGEMGELGDSADEAHREAGRLAARLEIDWLFALGDRAGQVVAGAVAAGLDPKRARAFDTCEEAAAATRQAAAPGDWILVKGSRAMKMELIVDALREGEEH